MRRTNPRGSALVEYLGVVAAVGVLMLALLVVRTHQPSRHPPIAPVAGIAALVAGPPPPPRARPRTPSRPRPPRPSRPRPPRPSVLVPTWAVGW